MHDPGCTYPNGLLEIKWPYNYVTTPFRGVCRHFCRGGGGGEEFIIGVYYSIT